MLVLAIASPVSLAAGLPLEQGSPLQRASDSYMGDWQGAKGSSLCAQVIALGGGAYQANILMRFDTREPVLAVLAGKLAEGKVVFEGKGEVGALEGTAWRAEISDNAFTGSFTGKTPGSFKMAHVERLSPTLGAKPPEDAVILFDGTHTDEWEHTKGDPRTVNFGRVYGGNDRLAYLRTLLWSPEDREAALWLGSDDGIKAWLNGTQVHAFMTTRGTEPGDDKVKVNLKAGWNDLLLKIVQISGGWGAVAEVHRPDGEVMGDIRFTNDFDSTGKPGNSEGVPLSDTEGFIFQWQTSGPYLVEGKGGSDLFEAAFAPEKGGEADWKPLDLADKTSEPCRWLILEPGVMEVRQGSILSKKKFRDHRIHLEFRLPFMPEAREQARANSGVYVQERYEIQILDSYGLEGLDNECGGLYTVAVPRVNMCAPPLQWQTYDIEYHAPKFSSKGALVENARITVDHNGVRIHDNFELPERTPGGTTLNDNEPRGLQLQDHGDPVWYRNIWVQELN